MLSVRKTSACPLDYSLCNQTVTVYHNDGGNIRRTVCDRAFLDFKKTQNTDKTGSSQVNTFLLVIPCDKQPVFVGDKVILGIGPKIATRDAWAAFIPANTPGLVVVRYADMKCWRGKPCHVEAGG